MSPPRRGYPWMDIDDAELLQLRRDGLNNKDIAQRIGRTQAATDGRLSRLKAMGRV